MALVQAMDSPPVFCDNTPYSAGLVRRLLGRLTGNARGVFGFGDLTATLSGSTVTIAAGRAALPAPATETGTYLVEATATTVLTLDPADATRPRRDVLVAYVVPPATADDVGRWYLEIRKGEPSTTPVAPTVTGAYLTAEFLIPSAASGTLPTVEDKRLTGGAQYIAGPSLFGTDMPEFSRPGQFWTSRATRETWVHNGVGWARVAGIPVVSSTSEVPAPYTDQLVYDRVVGVLKRYTGSTWVRYASADPTDPAPRGFLGGQTINHTNALGGAITGTEVHIPNMHSGLITLAPQRRFLITVTLKAQPSASGDLFVLRLRQAATSGVTGDMVREFIADTRQLAVGYTSTFHANYETGSSAEAKVFSLCALRSGGNGNLQFVGGGPNNRVGVWVGDIGPAGKTVLINS